MNLDQRLLRLVRGVRIQFAAAIGLGLLAGVLIVAQAYALAQAISRAFLGGEPLSRLWPWLAALGAIAAGRALALWGGEVAANAVAGHIKHDLRQRLYVRIVALGPAFTRGERSGELANTAVKGIEELDAYFRQYLPQLYLSALVPLLMLLAVFPVDTLSGVVLLVTAPLIPFFMILIGLYATQRSRAQWVALSRMSAHFLDVLQGLPTLKMFGRSRTEIETIRAMSDRFRDATMSVLRIAFLSALALELLATISVAIVAVEIGLRLLYARISFADAFFVLVIAPEFYLPLRLLGTRFHAGMAGVAAAERIFEVLETPLPPPPADSPAPLPRRVTALRFDDVRFAYDGGERPALNGVSFAVEPGEKVALVGPSGAGKTTIVQLVLRFVEPSGGQITIDGVPLALLPPDVWRAQIAWVPQRPHLFHTTIAENIRLGWPDAPLDAVMRAAEQAHADAFIRALPQGYATPVGERGARLSGGQAQRIALARAFLKDAPLLLLDEPTANLDPETEALLQDAMARLMHDRTTLIIAHRLTTVASADRIIVIDGGRVAEQGTHHDLLARGGIYQRLAMAYGR